MADADKPIIIIKKKGGHGGHHGGAWKVAYADFVTAMMAFFMVMWLLNTAQVQTRQAIAYYFRRPGWMQQQSATAIGSDGVGVLPEAFGPSASEKVSKNSRWEVLRKTKISSETTKKDSVEYADSKGLSKKSNRNNDPNGIIVSKTPNEIEYSTQQGPSDLDSSENLETLSETPDSMPASEKGLENELKDSALTNSPPTPAPSEIQAAKEAFENIRKVIERNPELRDILGNIEVHMDLEGITLEIMDTEKTSMFATGSTKILPRAELAFSGVVNLLVPLPYPIEVIGHTDATQFASSETAMSNWDLSALRANEARKVLQSNGLPANRVFSVIGKAETDLRFPEHPFAAGNRRITLRLKFANRPPNIAATSEPLRQQSAPRLRSSGVATELTKPLLPQPTGTLPPTTRPLAITVGGRSRAPNIPARAPNLPPAKETPARDKGFPILKPGELAQERISGGP